MNTATAAGALAVGGAAGCAFVGKRSATDMVPLGKSGIEVTRLALGTGTYGGRVQRELTQEAFTKVVRHAYDRGIRFFESADAYNEIHEKLAIALKGVPRDSYKLMTKFRLREAADAKGTIDRYRKELDSDYFDILLLHCVRTADWPTEYAKLRDEFSEAKEKKIILAHGASCHGLLPLRAFPGTNWLDVALLRINHDGTRMDSLNPSEQAQGDVKEVASRIGEIHAQGTGVIGMKLIGEGAFQSPEQRDASIQFVTGLGTVDSMTIGMKNTAEVDEAIELLDKHLNA
jgi:predicted aldo/keto reductase-like oxidoreductase